MPIHPPTLEHNYLKKIDALRLSHPPGTVVDVSVRHDPWCDKLHERGFCNCDPIVVQVSVPYIEH